MTEPAWQEAWRTLEVDDVDEHLLELTEKHLTTELASTDALATRLTAIVTFAGALLAVGITLSATAARARLDDDARLAFSILLVLAIALLIAAIVSSLVAIRPRERILPNPALLRHYAAERTRTAEVRADTFKLYGAGLEGAGLRNAGSARAARRSLALVALSLVVAAAAALIVYFSSPWPTTRQPSKQTPRSQARAAPPMAARQRLSFPRPSRRSG